MSDTIASTEEAQSSTFSYSSSCSYSRRKFALDYFVSVSMMLFLIPFFGILIFLIRRDGGPAFFKHARVGQEGRQFRCLKFRTMVTNSDEVLQHLLSTDPAAAKEWEETQKLRDDPRLTRYGRFLRTTSLDELPQLINVLRGEMSLVGPRPIVKAEIQRYGDHICYYMAVRPGITGLWQVSGRSKTTYDDRVMLDVRYVREWTIRKDIAILLRTVVVVIKRHGAH